MTVYNPGEDPAVTTQDPEVPHKPEPDDTGSFAPYEDDSEGEDASEGADDG
jgi:hypothetical protein